MFPTNYENESTNVLILQHWRRFYGALIKQAYCCGGSYTIAVKIKFTFLSPYMS